jgi:1-deoxy-D-xylulose-5-phosphate reductoisomerase
MKRISILGSTGSIGCNALDVVSMLGDRVSVTGLTTNRRIDVLRNQVSEYRPRAVAVADVGKAEEIGHDPTFRSTEIHSGPEGLLELATLPDADLVVNALVGAVGIRPTLAAIRAGKDVAIANKESLVAAGGLIIREAQLMGVKLIPVDSEHSAVYQCIRGERTEWVRRIILTASGGALIDMDADAIRGVEVSEVLKHPTWQMGRKVTIDSATLLNKGFEVIEAHWLFGVPAESIDVVVERKSVVHSLVEFIDGTVIAVMSNPDMRLPIQYALTCPDRVENAGARLDLEALGSIDFGSPDHGRFPCLNLAYDALHKGGTAPAVLSAADEVAVEAFLAGEIGFGDIQRVLARVVAAHEPVDADSVEAIDRADRWGRTEANEAIERLREER